MGYNTIKLKDYLHINEEYNAAAAITPGMLIELNSSGTVQKHASIDTFAMPMFATEDELQGKDITDAYVTGDKVQCWIPTRGDIVYALLLDGQNVSIGDKLVSASGGYLKKSESDFASIESVDAGTDLSTRVIIGIALEAQDLSTLEGSESSLATNSQYIKVRIV